MSTLLFLSFLTLQSFTLDIQLEGSWVNTTRNGETHVLLFSGPYFTHTTYQTKDGAFIMTKGGMWELSGDELSFTYEFHTVDSTLVGQTESQEFAASNSTFKLKGGCRPRGKWHALDKMAKTDLSSAWLFSGRKRDGEISRRDTDRPRKTMKILTGNRFQWIAYNTATKQFFGTGGGTYTANNGVYTENIEFFSRDDSRVGASLQFNYEMIDGEWHHSGKSSKGDPMYEIWSRRK